MHAVFLDAEGLDHLSLAPLAAHLSSLKIFRRHPLEKV